MTVRAMARWVATVTFGAVLLGACGGSGGDDRNPPTSEPGSAATNAADSAPAPTDMSEVTVELVELGPVTVVRDETAAVTASIGIDGGTITATDAAGTTFELTVPAGSLAADTEIVMTPAELDGVPFPTSTVMFGPTGLDFVNPATLTITTTTAIPVDEQFFYQLNDDATVFLATVPDSADATMAMQVNHFSGYGAGAADAASRAALLLKGAADADARISSQMAERVEQLRAEALLGSGSMADLTALIDEFQEEYVEQVIQPRLEAASSSCAATSLAVQTVLGFERMRALLAMEEAGFDLNGLVNDVYAEGGPCEQEAIARCKAAKDPALLIRFWMERLRMQALLGVESNSDMSAMVKKATKICKPVTYVASGAADGATFSGAVPSITAPFMIDLTFEGGNGTFAFTPADDGLSGTIAVEGGGSGATLSGGGSYTAVENDDGTVTLATATNSCVDVSGICRDSAAVITLTPSE